MKELAPILQQLAESLGTTTQYLWGVLVKQAPVQATIILIQMLLVVAFTIVLVQKHKKYSKEEYPYDMIEHPVRGVAMVVAAGLAVILLVVCFCYIPEMVNGFLRPEYWALDHILSTFKPQ